MVVSCNSRVSKPRHAHDTAVPRTGVKPALSANSAHTKKSSTGTAIAAEESAYTVGQASLSPAWSTSSTSNSNSSSEDYSGAKPAPPLVPLTQNKAAAEAIAANKMDIDMDLSGLLFDPSSCSLEQGTQQQQQQWLAGSCSQQMFPALLAPSALNDATATPSSSLAGGLAPGAHTTTTTTAIVSDAVLPDSIPSTATDAALDGWLQQFVNAEAIGGSTSSTIMSSPYSHVPCVEYSPDLPFSSSVEANSSVAALFSSSVSPGLSYISPQSSVFPFDSTAASVPVLPGILPLHGSPAMNPLPSSSQSPTSSSLSSVDAAGILDQSAVNAFAAAAAAAIAGSSSSSLPTSDASISPEMLASVLSSAAGICSHNNASSTTIEPQELLPPAASEISMLAALPFASIAMPMTNIAPQKTLSVAHADVSDMEALDATEARVSQPVVSALPLPPTKRQRRSDPPLNNINNIASQQKALGCQFANVAGGRTGPVASGGNVSASSSQNSSRSNADATATVSKKSNTTAVAVTPENRVPASVSPRSTASVSSLGKGSRHNMVPLAPRLPAQSPSESTDANKRQQQQQQSAKNGAAQNKPTNGKKSVLASVSSSDSSRSGSSTPPGLSVLAKIAQKQVPIRVKEEEAMAMNSIDKKQQQQQQNVYQGRLIAPSPANRQTRSPSLPPSQTEESKTSPSNTPDSAAQKRQERLIKNRAAALLSRKRKRDYMTKLESEVEDLRSFNNSLVKRLEDMERAMKALAEERDLLRSESVTARGLMSATSSSSAGAATSSTSASASDSNNKNKDSSTSEDSTKEQKESSESNEGKGNGVEASDCAMDTDDDMSEEKQQQQQHTTAGYGTSSKQRTAGTLLMAMLFSFSLFTLPSLYTSSNQITAGGPQSAGIVPIQSLPSSEPRLLIGSGKRIDNAAEPPLIERVRRSISALAQQAGPASPQQTSGGDAAQYANGSDSSTNWMRPMSMEESAVLHAWIRHGLSSGSSGAGNSAASASNEYDAVVTGKDGAPSMQKELERKIRAESEPTSLSVVRQQPRQTNNDHAMLYCPAMQHVVFSGNSVEAASMSGLVSGGNDAFVYRPSEPRVIGTTKQQASGGKTKTSSDVAVVRGGMDDVDSKIVVASPRVGSVADWHSASHDLPLSHAAAAATAATAAGLVPTHAGGIVIPPASTNRPKLSLYSPVVSGGSKGADAGILPPWDEHARLLAASDSDGNDDAAAPLAEAAESSRQRYLRIDVEVVGSRWVTADKFAHGLY
ncbi:hypothetical protein IWW48_000876 [Coemansia sp. RSA 1200]|nr:hypothetical protein IWW48_000876 [Coemansia sp. RSA 1200]